MTQDALFAIEKEPTLDELINDVLWRTHEERPVPAKAKELIQILQYCRGQHNAKPLHALSLKLGVSPREVKQLAKDLTEDFGIPIGASRTEPYGYYLCATKEDKAAAKRPYAHEVMSMLKRINVIEPDPRLHEVMSRLQVILS